MSRFSNLEFNQEPGGEFNANPQIRDEAFYAAEAQQACEHGDFELGLRYYAKVLEFNPQAAGAWCGQVRMLIELGEYKEAKVWADKALERLPHDPELLAAKAVALGRLGEFESAMAFSDAAFEERGDTPYIWLARGDVLLARQEKRADYCFEKACAMDPSHWFVPWLAARIYFFYKKFALALKMAQDALSRDNTRGIVWLELGLCQLKVGLLQPARISFDQARQLDPQAYLRAQPDQPGQEPGWADRLRGWWRQLFHR